MKKMKLLVLGCGLLLVTSFAPKQTLIKENKDLILSCEEKNNVGINLKKLATTSSATVGKTYVQNGEYDANKMLRFATPVNGDFDSLTYHIEIEGYPEVVSKNVETVYKGIETNGTVSYFNGTDVVTKEDELTKEWYWACFTIEFTSYKYYTASINAYVTGSSSLVEGELKSEAKNDVSLRDELMKGDTPSLKALDTKTLGEWRNDGATIVVKNNQLTYSKGGVDTVLNYVNVDGYFFVFADGNNNELEIKYSSQYSNQLDVNGVINESKVYYQSFSKFVAITSLELTTKKTELVYGLDRTFTINATTNKDATGEDIVWSCDDDRFEFDGSGKSIYVSVPELYEFEYGEENVIATFTAKSAEGGISDSIEVTIRKKIEVKYITLKEPSLEMLKGETKDITASVNSDADVKTLKYTSSNSKIAKVSVNSTTGVATVTAVAEEGETDIKVESTDGSNISKKIHIVVKKPTASESAFKNQAFVGTWTGMDDLMSSTTTLTINKDGTALLENDYGDSITFSFEKEENDKAFFNSENNIPLEVELANADANLHVTVNNGEMLESYCQYLGSYLFEK
ncbi:pKD repeats containing lipoprotein [Firmicutes bacterium CAG:449]|nr:pKD repeats containing lipoprotein [Firmicutes bacterium CAG:449]